MTGHEFCGHKAAINGGGGGNRKGEEDCERQVGRKNERRIEFVL